MTLDLNIMELDSVDDVKQTLETNNLVAKMARGGVDKRLRINVGGVVHETMVSTLENMPGTRLALLANLQEADESYDVSTGEYFFDRHPFAFHSVMHYYRTEELHVDRGLCGNVMKAELCYWGVCEHDIEACCWADYSRYTEHKQTLRDLDDNFAYAEGMAWAENKSCWRKYVQKIWRFLEEPGSSRWAKLYAVISMSFVALSILIFVLETHKLFQIDKDTGRPMKEVQPDDPDTPTGAQTKCCCGSRIAVNTTGFVAVKHPVLNYLDYVCVSFFTFEIILRFMFCPDKCRFLRSPLNIIDIVCLVPHYATIILEVVDGGSDYTDIFRVIISLRIVRILRIFKLMKHYNAFKILVYTIKVSTKELLLMVVFLMTGVLMFASIIHYAEEENFPNIPIGIWWALVTMTTVGYGDKYPIGYIGYVVGSVCVVCGVLVIAFTVPIVVNNFSLYYSHAQTRIKVPKSQKRLKRLIASGKMDAPRNRAATASTRLSDSSDTCNFNTIPHSPRDVKPMNIGDKTNNLSIPPGTKSVTRIKKVIAHTFAHRKPRHSSSCTPIEISDVDSNDSGFTDSSKRKLKEETQKIMDNMKDNENKMADERRRQEWLIQAKRDQRSKRQAGQVGDDKTDIADDTKQKAGK